MIAPMRTILILLLVAPYIANAQTAGLLKNDLGPMAEVQLTDNFITNNSAGIQLRHQCSGMVAWRASVSYFNLRQRGPVIHLYPFTNTITTRSVDDVVDGIAVGGGMEVQRQFYRKVYLYAGADLKIGYGTARRDTQITYEYYTPSTVFPGQNDRQFSTTQIRHSANGRGIVVTTAVLVGAKIYTGKRIIIGTEFTNPLYYVNIKTGDQIGASSSGLDFTIGQIMQRVYVTYRF